MARRIMILIGIVVLISCNIGQTPATPTLEVVPSPPTEALSCDQIITSALQTAGTTCAALERNVACYGNRLVSAEFVPNVTETFTNPGDTSQLIALKKLSAAPFNEAAQTWGVAVLEAQANIPDTLPGQSVTFILFGETSLDGITPDMQAVTLSTGIGRPTCASVPPSALLVQSPGDLKVTMQFNGASVTLGSTLYLTAIPNGQLTIATLEGQAVVQAFNTSQTVLPGTQVKLPLGTTDGLQVIGPPSPPEPYNLSDIRLAPLTLLKRPVQPPQPGGVTPTSAAATRPAGPDAAPTACVPRADWTGSYVIQPGDTLFSIAQRYRVNVDDLQLGNCVADPNRISVGQVLRVPFQPTSTSRPASTSTPTLRPSATTPPTATSQVLRPPTDTVEPAKTQDIR